jgi:hypothetical protein
VEGDRIETLLLHKLNHSVDVLIDDELEIWDGSWNDTFHWKLFGTIENVAVEAVNDFWVLMMHDLLVSFVTIYNR